MTIFACLFFSALLVLPAELYAGKPLKVKAAISGQTELEVNEEATFTLRLESTLKKDSIRFYYWQCGEQDGFNAKKSPYLTKIFKEPGQFIIKGKIETHKGGVTPVTSLTVNVGVQGILIKGFQEPINTSIGDTVIYNPRIFSNEKITKVKWDFQGKGRWNVMSSKLEPRRYVYKKAGEYQCVLKVATRSGLTKEKKLRVHVTNRTPVITLEKQIKIAGHDSLEFKLKVSDDGRIVKTRWDFEGDGKWDWQSEKLAFPKFRYKQATTVSKKVLYKPMVEVMDDDGNTARGSQKVWVDFKIPKADAGKSTIVCLGDTISYNGWRSLAVVGEIDRWEWDFNADGKVDTVCLSGDVKRVTPPKPATYYSRLWVVDEYGNRSAADSVTIIVIKDHPTARVDSEAVATILDTVRFFGHGIKRCGNISEYRWDFDGNGKWDWKSDVNEKVHHVYRVPGIYYAKFQLVGDDKLTGSAVKIVRVKKDMPSVRINKDTTVAVGHAVEFLGTASDSLGKIVKMGWSFEGKKRLDVSGKKAKTYKHVYKKPGTYRAEFRATDDDGQTAKATRTVTVTNEFPKVNSIRSDTTLGINEDLIYWVKASDDGEIVEITWDFEGDGKTDWTSPRQDSVRFRFTRPGKGESSRLVSSILKVRDDYGNVSSDTVHIRIQLWPPSARIEGPTVATINDPIVLDAAGSSDTNGRVASYRWKTLGGFEEGPLKKKSNLANRE